MIKRITIVLLLIALPFMLLLYYDVQPFEIGKQKVESYWELKLDTDSSGILFTGDMSFGDNYIGETRDWHPCFKGRRYGDALLNYKQIIKGASLSVVNLETPLTTRTRSPLHLMSKWVHYNHADSAIRIMKDYDIDIVSLGNNHAMDFCEEGMHETVEALEVNDIHYLGAGLNLSDAIKPIMIKRKDKAPIIVCAGYEYRMPYNKYAYDFYATDGEPGTNSWIPWKAVKQIESIRVQYPEATIVAYPHWGANYVWASSRLKRFAHRLIEAGADIIIGHGAHMMQELEVYQDKLIVYSLGNFVFNSWGRYAKKGVKGYSLIAKWYPGIENRFCFYPIMTDNRATCFKGDFLSEQRAKEAYQLLLEKSNDVIISKKLQLKKDSIGYLYEIIL